jgi:hypothetical protein
VTRLDSDGSELMIVWGAGGTPHHDDGTPVVTPRLYAKLTPLEIDLYSGDSLRAHLAKRVAYRTNGEPIDGWAPEDFVSFGLIEASKYGWYTRSAVVTWVHRKIDSVRRRADARHVEPCTCLRSCRTTCESGWKTGCPTGWPDRFFFLLSGG